MKKITLAAVFFGLLFATSVFAEIIVGLSSTNISNDVTITQLTLNTPVNAAAGDFLVANVSVNGGSSAGITAPAEWTLIRRTDNGTSIGIASYGKVAGASEPSSYTWTISPQTRAAGGITAYAGIDTASPIDVSSGATGRGKVATAPSVTTTQDGNQVLALFASNFGKGDNETFSTTQGMTKLYDVRNAPSGPTIAAEDKTEASAGTAGPFAVTISQKSQRDWVAQTIVLKKKSTNTLANGLVAYWKLDGDSTDSVGTNNGSDMNVAYSTSNGKINIGAGFDGSTSAINLGNMISGVTDFSICSWLKTSIATGGHIIIGQRDNSSVDGQFLFGISDGKLYIVTYDNAHTYGYADVTYSNTMLADGNWHSVCFTSNGTSGTFYRDGVQDGTLNASSVITFSSSITGEIGYDRRDGSGRWNGDIDEVGFWSRALSATEVAQLYNNGSGVQHPF
jgi:hypothetical protein